MYYDTFENTRLWNVLFGVFEACKDRLTELWSRCAEHYFNAFAYAENGAGCDVEVFFWRGRGERER